METKLSKLIDFMADDDWDRALSLAATFPRLGEHKDDILTADAAIKHSRFYVQIGRDVADLRQRGIAALRARYAKPYGDAMKRRAVAA